MDEPPPNPEPQPRSTRRLWPTDFQHRTLWMALTAAALLAIAAISVYVIGVFARVLQFLQPVLVPVALAGILAYLLEPIVRRLTNRGTPRFRAMISVWIAFHALILLLFLSVAVPTISQGARIIRSSRHTWVQSASHFIGNTVRFIGTEENYGNRWSTGDVIDMFMLDYVEDEVTENPEFVLASATTLAVGSIAVIAAVLM
jgi:predicted PurR-regulated permease PerM